MCKRPIISSPNTPQDTLVLPFPSSNWVNTTLKTRTSPYLFVGHHHNTLTRTSPLPLNSTKSRIEKLPSIPEKYQDPIRGVCMRKERVVAAFPLYAAPKGPCPKKEGFPSGLYCGNLLWRVISTSDSLESWCVVTAPSHVCVQNSTFIMLDSLGGQHGWCSSLS